MTKKYKLQISEPHIEDTETGECYDLHGKDNLMYIVELWNKIVDENRQLKQRIKKLEIENQGQSDAIDGLQGFIAHFDLEDLE